MYWCVIAMLSTPIFRSSFHLYFVHFSHTCFPLLLQTWAYHTRSTLSTYVRDIGTLLYRQRLHCPSTVYISLSFSLLCIRSCQLKNKNRLIVICALANIFHSLFVFSLSLVFISSHGFTNFAATIKTELDQTYSAHLKRNVAATHAMLDMLFF